MTRTRLALLGIIMAAPMAPSLGQGQTAPSPPALQYSQPLSIGATVLVQEKLQQAGTYSGRSDGIWGPDSQAALERFQQTRSLQVSGQLNQATLATLGIAPADLLAARPMAPNAAATTPDPLSPAVVRNVQQRLRALGFYRGAVDGLWGAGTQAALERFQQGRALQSTGQINPATLQALGLDPSNPTAAYRPHQ